MPLEIRRAVVADARAIAAVGIDGWRAAYAGIVPRAVLDALDLDAREATFREHLSAPPERRGTWVGVEDGRVVGFVSYGPCRDEDAAPGEGEVYALYVRPERIGAGLGRALCARALEELERLQLAPVSLWVLTDNARARRFYERQGFAVEPGRERVAKEVRGAALDHARYRRP